MPRDLIPYVEDDPSDGFHHWPVPAADPLDLVVSFDVHAHDRIRARMHGSALPTLPYEHAALLSVGTADVRAAAARLRAKWNAFVRHQPVDGRRIPVGPVLPFASGVDLRGHPALPAQLDALVRAGTHLLFGVLLSGEDAAVRQFREHLVRALEGRGRDGDGLRIRFDSELGLPWPLLGLPGPGRGADGPEALLDRLLGLRHQIEHSSPEYRFEAPAPPQPLPRVSLNHDKRVDRRSETCAAKVADALAHTTDPVVREDGQQLVEDLREAVFEDRFMYFWCHGVYVASGPDTPYLTIRLSDGVDIDGLTVDECREEHRGSPDARFQPFVLLNACHAGVWAPDHADTGALARALVRAGARGVLAPLIEMPQVFAAEYAHGFVTAFLTGAQSAGTVARALARRYATEFHNPLGAAYGLLCGMDHRLAR
ncbi:CHAT domain-containing protein [Streptomyces sp. NPDC050504]|uniref:CHAT domain-containing protein n=1 Tax=Streptomyces sp. NPDC050504 TaxID=3365618 RepID=UPI0037948E99